MITSQKIKLSTIKNYEQFLAHLEGHTCAFLPYSSTQSYNFQTENPTINLLKVTLIFNKAHSQTLQ